MDEDQQDTDKMTARSWLSKFQLLRSAIEFLGRHPFATGLLALLGILGFILSVAGYKLDRQESRETSEQLTAMQGGVEEVIQNIHSPCTSPPCWDLGDLMRASTIGRSKDLLDAKLPPAEYVKNNQAIYNIKDCNVRIEYRNNSVSYIAADLYRRERSENGETKKIPCPFEIPGIKHYTSYSTKFDDSKYNPSEYPSFPTDNTLVSLRDILSLTHDDIRLSVACIDCGNYSEPYIEAYALGSHAEDFINFYFEISYWGHPDADFAHKAWNKMQASFDAIGPDPDKYHYVETTDYCGTNVLPQMASIMAFNVERVGIGRGTRVWSGPKALFCP